MLPPDIIDEIVWNLNQIPYPEKPDYGVSVYQMRMGNGNYREDHIHTVIALAHTCRAMRHSICARTLDVKYKGNASAAYKIFVGSGVLPPFKFAHVHIYNTKDHFMEDVDIFGSAIADMLSNARAGATLRCNDEELLEVVNRGLNERRVGQNGENSRKSMVDVNLIYDLICFGKRAITGLYKDKPTESLRKGNAPREIITAFKKVELIGDGINRFDPGTLKFERDITNMFKCSHMIATNLYFISGKFDCLTIKECYESEIDVSVSTVYMIGSELRSRKVKCEGLKKVVYICNCWDSVRLGDKLNRDFGLSMPTESSVVATSNVDVSVVLNKQISKHSDFNFSSICLMLNDRVWPERWHDQNRDIYVKHKFNQVEAKYSGWQMYDGYQNEMMEHMLGTMGDGYDMYNW